MEPLNPINNKKAYLMMISIWLSYIIQIIVILSFTLSNMEYYQNTMIYLDLGLFLIWCGVCILISYAFARNKSSYYKSSLFFIFTFVCLIIISIYRIFSEISNKYPGNGNNTLLLMIKIFEIIPLILIFINAKLFNQQINNINNNYDHLDNNNDFVNNNNAFMNNNNNNGFMNNNNGLLNNN